MEIVFVTGTPAFPRVASGPAGVQHALAKSLRHLDHSCRVVAPLYRGIDPSAHGLARRLTKLPIELNGEKLECELYDGRTPGGVEVVFIGHPELFGRVDGLDEGSPSEIADRAAAFSQALIVYLEQQDRKIDVLHGHDWLGAIAVTVAKRRLTVGRLVLTLHEPTDVELSASHLTLLGLDADGGSSLELGVKQASVVTTVSPTYAEELASRGDGLARALKDRGEQFLGVLSGVDAAVWNPATDAHLPARFDPMDLNGKARCKSNLQQTLGLPSREDIPLIGVLANDSVEGGFDLIPAIVPRLLRNDCQCVVLWEGKETDALFTSFARFSDRWSDRLQVRLLGGDTVERNGKTEEDLAHAVIGASDLVLVPSREEPCGYVQMYAHRYGALPIVRRTGGLADTVVDCDATLGTGNGFVFDEAQPDALLGAVQRGLAAFQSMAAFTAAQRRAMRIDHSWDRPARIYEQIYRG